MIAAVARQAPVILKEQLDNLEGEFRSDDASRHSSISATGNSALQRGHERVRDGPVVPKGAELDVGDAALA